MNHSPHEERDSQPREKRQFWDKTGIHNLAAIAGILSLVVAIIALRNDKATTTPGGNGSETPDTVTQTDTPVTNATALYSGNKTSSQQKEEKSSVSSPASARLFNSGEEATLGVIGSDGKAYDALLTNQAAKWLIAKGVKASHTIVLDGFVQGGYFRKVMQDDYSVFETSEAKKAMQYLLLIRKGSVSETSASVATGNPLLREQGGDIKDIQSDCDVRLVDVKNGKLLGKWNKIFREKAGVQTSPDEVINTAIGNYVKSLDIIVK